jgi:hypothetical protein
MNTRNILNARHTTHGDFTDHAAVTQRLKDIIEGEPGWDKLNPCQREALAMFAHKIARILVGNPNFKDHWDDISGYALLVSDRIAQPPTGPGTPEDGGHHARQQVDDDED